MFRRIKVKHRSRVLLIRNGRLVRVLEPGSHIVFLSPFADWKTEVHRVDQRAFRSRWADQLLREKSKLVERHFHLVKAKPSELAMVSVDGNLYQVLLPSQRALFWKGEGKLVVEYVNVVDEDDETYTAFGDSLLETTEVDEQLSAFEDSTSGFLIERVFEHDASSSGPQHGS